MEPPRADSMSFAVRILWWIIGLLTCALAGAGSNWVTNLQATAALQAEVHALDQNMQRMERKIDGLDQRPRKGGQ